MKKRRFDPSRFYRLLDALIPLIAVLAALAVGAIILLLQDTNPATAYEAMFSGAFTNKNGLADTFVKAIPLLLVALGVAIAFRGGVINIGAEGQIIVGALFTTFVGLQLGDKLPGPIVILICLIAGALMGGKVLQLTLANGGQTMIYADSLPDEAVAAAQAAEQGIIDGSIEIVAEPR